MQLNERDLVSDEPLFREMKRYYSMYFKGGMGAEAIRDLLEAVDPEQEAATLKANMILDVIPVIPPDLRPMVQLDGGRFAAST